ncbi:MAG: NADH-quinone oxidoreductase subunit L, partial [Rhodocyclaceae bacterium]|nr:NADH-quinone oxidoreductase subunit L [Rhodocyclaceae bacterium]
AHHGGEPHETPWVVWLPLVALAIPSMVIGYYTIEPMLFGGWFGNAIYVSEAHNVVAELGHEFHGAAAMAKHGFGTLPFFLAMGGVLTAYLLYMVWPSVPVALKAAFMPIYKLLDNKYFFDRFNEIVFAAGARLIGKGLWKGGDQGVIDGVAIHGSVRVVGLTAAISRALQTGHIYEYAFAMILGLMAALLWFFS